MAPPVSAQKPPTGLSLVRPMPIVLTMRQPPNSVPRPIAAWHARMTHSRHVRRSAHQVPLAISSAMMMPIVFCASLPPWPSEQRRRAGAEPRGTSGRPCAAACAGTARTRRPSWRRRARMPISGARRMNSAVLATPGVMTLEAALARRRRRQAADQRVRRAGRQAPPPRQQVPDDRADQRAEQHGVVDRSCGSMIPLAIVFATCGWKMTNATKLKNAAQSTARRGDSTRVDTTVAIEFAASWKPLMTSNGQRDQRRSQTIVTMAVPSCARGPRPR